MPDQPIPDNRGYRIRLMPDNPHYPESEPYCERCGLHPAEWWMVRRHLGLMGLCGLCAAPVAPFWPLTPTEAAQRPRAPMKEQA